VRRGGLLETSARGPLGGDCLLGSAEITCSGHLTPTHTARATPISDLNLLLKWAAIDADWIGCDVTWLECWVVIYIRRYLRESSLE